MFDTSSGRAEMLPDPDRERNLLTDIACTSLRIARSQGAGNLPHRSHVSGGRLDVSARVGVLLAAHANGSSYQTEPAVPSQS